MKGFIYLAGPYSHVLQTKREQRFLLLTIKAAELMLEGITVYSPITHGHTIADCHDLPTDFEWWSSHCLGMLEQASKMIVLKLADWDISVGVAAEIEFAKSLGIPIEYHEVVPE